MQLSNYAYVVMISTPNAPNGLLEKIEKEPEASCIYKRLKIDYTYGLGKIYAKEAIQKAMKSPSFGREYDFLYLGLILIGKTFHTADIERAIALGKKYKITNNYAQQSIGIDPGFGSSPFGISKYSSAMKSFKYHTQTSSNSQDMKT